jgi:dienelactone hydrolase
VHAALTKPLDWFSIQLARLSVRNGATADGQAAAAEALLRRPEFFAEFASVPPTLNLTGRGRFQFPSPVRSPWARNNTVHGRFFPVAEEWSSRPAVLLLHGWNAEIGYRTLFPYLARRLNAAGVNALMYELPYHSQRKPRERGSATNFLSGDLLHVIQAVHQALADARALVAWLGEQGCERVGVWGISLGGWLAGLLACEDSNLSFAVMMTPVARMDRVIAELDFCRPIRRSLRSQSIHLEPLNLVAHQPKLPAENILVVASEHDLFAPIETIEELCQTWRWPELWRPRHGHISVLMSAPVMERVVHWIEVQDKNCYPS